MTNGQVVVVAVLKQHASLKHLKFNFKIVYTWFIEDWATNTWPFLTLICNLTPLLTGNVLKISPQKQILEYIPLTNRVRGPYRKLR